MYQSSSSTGFTRHRLWNPGTVSGCASGGPRRSRPTSLADRDSGRQPLGPPIHRGSAEESIPREVARRSRAWARAARSEASALSPVSASTTARSVAIRPGSCPVPRGRSGLSAAEYAALSPVKVPSAWTDRTPQQGSSSQVRKALSRLRPNSRRTQVKRRGQQVNRRRCSTGCTASQPGRGDNKPAYVATIELRLTEQRHDITSSTSVAVVR